MIVIKNNPELSRAFQNEEVKNFLLELFRELDEEAC